MIYERSVNEKRKRDSGAAEGGGPKTEEGWDRRGKVGTGDGEHTRNPKVAV